MLKWISAAVAAIVVVLTIWFASPYAALRGIQQAVADNNPDALSEHVDYTALRSNVKVRVREHIVENMPKDWPKMVRDSVLAKFAPSLDAGVDKYVSPDMLKNVMLVKPVKGSGQKDAEDIQRSWDVRWWTKRQSLDVVILHIASTNPKYEGREVLVHFQRVSGITWKIVDVDPSGWKAWWMDRVQRGMPTLPR